MGLACAASGNVLVSSPSLGGGGEIQVAEDKSLMHAMMFERPIKGDLDRSLSLLMHEARHKVMDECNRIKTDAIKAGALQSNRVIVAVAQVADTIHKQAMEQAKPILFDFIERMQLAPVEITGWARPHLENLGNSVLSGIPPNGFPADHQRIHAQYAAVFKQRLDGVLRDVEIGFVKGAGFARAEKVESKEEWITAVEAARLLKPVFNSEYMVRMTICKRAHSGMIRLARSGSSWTTRPAIISKFRSSSGGPRDTKHSNKIGRPAISTRGLIMGSVIYRRSGFLSSVPTSRR
jgi:hypothetical protein